MGIRRQMTLQMILLLKGVPKDAQVARQDYMGVGVCVCVHAQVHARAHMHAFGRKGSLFQGKGRIYTNTKSYHVWEK